MGRLVASSVLEEEDLELVAAVDPAFGGERLGDLIGNAETDVVVAPELSSVLPAGPEVLVDFTRPDAVMGNVRWAIGRGLHVVVGTTGIGDEDLAEVRRLLERDGARSGAIVVPNFAIGAVLLQRFAAEAARFFAAAEIVELHHDGKVDAPSGTALATAKRMARARRERWDGPGGESLHGVRGGDVDGIRVHSVRLPGLVAHQEVILGGLGQTLTLRHDSIQRESFIPGVLLAVRSVTTRPGLTVGLEPLLGLAASGG